MDYLKKLIYKIIQAAALNAVGCYDHDLLVGHQPRAPDCYQQQD
jgi:hypothetical protein